MRRKRKRLQRRRRQGELGLVFYICAIYKNICMHMILIYIHIYIYARHASVMYICYIYISIYAYGNIYTCI
jgi:hypothetical protein